MNKKLKNKSSINTKLFSLFPMVSISILFFGSSIIINYLISLFLINFFYYFFQYIINQKIKFNYSLIYSSFLIVVMFPVSINYIAVIIFSFIFAILELFRYKYKLLFISNISIAWVIIYLMFSITFKEPLPSNLLKKIIKLKPDLITTEHPILSYLHTKESAYSIKQLFLGFFTGIPSQLFTYAILIGLYLLFIKKQINYLFFITTISLYSLLYYITYLLKFNIVPLSIDLLSSSFLFVLIYLPLDMNLRFMSKKSILLLSFTVVVLMLSLKINLNMFDPALFVFFIVGLYLTLNQKFNKISRRR